MRTPLQELSGGVFVDAKRGPTGALHAVSPGADPFGARRSACKLIGRFMPPGDAFETFPESDEPGTIPRCEKCTFADAEQVTRTLGFQHSDPKKGADR